VNNNAATDETGRNVSAAIFSNIDDHPCKLQAAVYYPDIPLALSAI
jgi:hypothetical protein